MKVKATRFLTYATNYDELIETFKYLPSIELERMYKKDIRDLAELVGTKPFPTEITIPFYGSDYSPKLLLNGLSDITRILIDLERFNKPDYTIVKQIKATCEKKYDSYYNTILLQEITELKTNLETIHERNKS